MKNVKIYKKLVSMVAAGMLMVSPILASAEGNTNDNNYGFTLVKQEMKVEGNDLNIDKYISELENSYNYLAGKIGTDGLQAELQVFYTIFNRSYMSTKTYNELVEQGAIYSDEYINENFNQAFKLVYRIISYNEETIRNDYNNGTMDINHLIDPSVFCYDSHDKKIVRSAFEHYFNAYKNGLFENEDYVEAFKVLTTLNSQEKGYNAIQAEAGATWGLKIIIGRLTMKMLENDMLKDYSIDELSKYFVREQLEADPRKWVIRDDVVFDLNCLNELEYEIFNYRQLENFCYKFVNNNVYKLFNVTRNLETENPLECYEHVESDLESTTNGVEEQEVTISGETEEDYTKDYSYSECVDRALKELSGKVEYDHVKQHLNCFAYLGNREYLTEEEEVDLINQGIVYKTDFSTAEGTQNFVQAIEFVGNILDYNQSVIRSDYENGTMDINHLIDPSIFCMKASDRKIVHDLHVAYFEAYKNGRFDNDYCRYVIYELINNKDISFGPMWCARYIVGYDTMQMLMDDMQADFDPRDIVKFFDNVEQTGAQWVSKAGVEPSAESSDELEREAAYFKALYPVINGEINNDLFESFGIPCSK